MQGITAFAAALLVGLFTGSWRRMLVATIAIAAMPEAQPMLMGGYCEPSCTAILVVGTLLICCGGRSFYFGVMVLSLLPLVRPNFLLLWPAAVALIWWRQIRGRPSYDLGHWRRLAAATLLFCVPTTVWVIRNYLVSGLFPMVAGTSSLTLYGNYNTTVAAPGPNFGVFALPPTTDQNVRGLSEAAMLRFYDRSGREFITHHLKLMPLLLAAHVVHTVLPYPNDGAHKYSFWLFRLLLYAAAIVLFRRRAIVLLESGFGIIFTCSLLTTAVTVVMYSGDTRYLYPLNVLVVAALCSASYKYSAQPSRSVAAAQNTEPRWVTNS
jgi:hypothetical protein